MNIFRKIRASLRLREAVRQADEKHKETGERYYVMPAGGKKGQLIIMDRKNFRKFIIRKSKFPQNPKRSVRFSGKRTKRSVQKRKARNTQKAETKVL